MAAAQLTSTTAPGKVFASRQELADHYKSDWHKYNLKRREAGLPLLLESDFQARLAAALSIRQEQQQRGGGGPRDGTGHLKKGKKQKKKKQHHQQNNTNNNNNNSASVAAAATTEKSQAGAYYDNIKKTGGEGNTTPVEEEERAATDEDEKMQGNEQQQQAGQEEEEEEEEQENVVIDPKQCLFDRHFAASVEANADRMYRKYGFFIPDREYLIDLEGLIGYCHEKIKLGHMCLYCHKVFPTWEGCQKHMISKRHTKLKYETGIDLEDLSVFYDFSKADSEFLRWVDNKASSADDNNDNNTDDNDEIMEDDGDEDWEDISDDEAADPDAADGNEGEDEEDEYEEQLAQFGFDVTELGELVLPNGRVIGHRALSRYYKQRVPSRDNSTSTAVVAARRAAGERLFNGQVINIHGTEENSLALAKVGIKPGAAAGRAGNGILVKGEEGMYTSLSIYRYRAAMRKQRREDKQGKRLYEKTKQNMNRMDKKHNRLMNGVSVAHAAR